MTTQEAFHRVYRHLLTQGHRATRYSKTNYVSCVYRGEDGSRCAIGALIPDELYKPELEGLGVLEIMQGNQEIVALFEDVPHLLLERLQELHDHVPAHLWKEGLEEIADDYGLKVPS